MRELRAPRRPSRTTSPPRGGPHRQTRMCSRRASISRTAKGGREPASDIGEQRAALRIGPRMCRAWWEMEQVTIAPSRAVYWRRRRARGIARFRFCAAAPTSRAGGCAGHEHELGLSARLLALMGPARTKQAVSSPPTASPPMTRTSGTGREGLAADRSYPSHDFAERIAALPPLAVTMKKPVSPSGCALDELAAHMDTDQFALASLTEDHKEGVIAFLERRKPRFRGR